MCAYEERISFESTDWNSKRKKKTQFQSICDTSRLADLYFFDRVNL